MVIMGSRDERHGNHHELVPLATLISRELKNERMEKPIVRYGCAAQSRKGEDYFLMKTDCQRVLGNPSYSLSVFAVFYVHNGNVAAIYSKDNLLNHVLSAIPRGLGRHQWLRALPRALAPRGADYHNYSFMAENDRGVYVIFVSLFLTLLFFLKLSG